MEPKFPIQHIDPVGFPVFSQDSENTQDKISKITLEAFTKLNDAYQDHAQDDVREKFYANLRGRVFVKK